MRKFDVYKYREYYKADMYSESNRVKNLEAVAVPDCDGLAVLLGRPVNRKEGAARLQVMASDQIGYFEMIWLNPSCGPYLHIQADVRRADNGAMLKKLQACINWEKSRAAKDETHYIRFLLKERT